MKKVILSMVFAFTVTTFVNATILREGINCVQMAMDVGDWAEEAGASYAEAYEEANQAYEDCMAWQE